MAMYKSLKNYDEAYASFIAEKLLKLRAQLDLEIQQERKSNSLIIGSWNIREFDSGKGGVRLDESYHYMAEIIDHFDICAIQEIKSDLAPLRRLVRLMGPNWDYFVSDVTAGAKGNNERMAFVFNKNKVRFRNLIGEIVLPENKKIKGHQFARTPLFAAFQAGWFRFVLCNVHMYYGAASGDKLAHRVAEIEALAKETATRGKKTDEVHVLLGDMNVVGKNDDTMNALSKHLQVPDFGPTNLLKTKYYDQIAFSHQGKKTRILNKGVVDYRDILFRGDEKAHYEKYNVKDDAGTPRYKTWNDRWYREWSSHQLSDHLPIWIELEVDYSDAYLERFV